MTTPVDHLDNRGRVRPAGVQPHSTLTKATSKLSRDLSNRLKYETSMEFGGGEQRDRAAVALVLAYGADDVPTLMGDVPPRDAWKNDGSDLNWAVDVVEYTLDLDRARGDYRPERGYAGFPGRGGLYELNWEWMTWPEVSKILTPTEYTIYGAGTVGKCAALGRVLTRNLWRAVHGVH